MGKLKPNQFNPTPEEIEEIKRKNESLEPLEKRCFKCGHNPCHYCGPGDCDTFLHDVEMLGNWEDYDPEDINKNGEVFPPHPCCFGQCEY